LRLSRDGWTGLAVLAASAVLFVLTLGLKPSVLVPVGPGFYPRIILAISGALGARLHAQDLLGGKAGAGPRGRPAPLAAANYALVFTIFAMFGVYVVALPELGYRIATFAFCAALQATLEPPSRPRAWAIIALSALATTLVTFYLFEQYLQVLLPRGRWTDF
jgi:hypothetical protein